ncbi:hypothetical protein CHCC5027_3550 [Bacillus paralicheniformis]|uniref:hypothetical protein n=1 Tax=Bacillus paralicheniformis TaxID=1648923 RepID=UPI0011A8A98C|nr:hypothetical protein [Bacillus paralicheniformis]TWJ39637.1 hypothetical protein CHCC5027_3550 [Bacillus paralicheniformis]
MRQKEPFERVDIEHIRKVKEERRMQKKVEILQPAIDEAIETKCNKMAQRLVKEGKDIDDYTFDVHSFIDGGKLFVEISLSRKLDTLEFDLSESPG